MDMRKLKGEMIAKHRIIRKEKNGWLVPSQTTDNQKYFVDEEFNCNCPDSEFHNRTCKHSFAVRYYLQKETFNSEGVRTEKMRLTYSQAWGAYTKAQSEEIILFDKLLRELVNEINEPAQGRGRPRMPLREQVFCSIMKVYSQLSSRRARSLFVHAQERQQIGKAPCYNMVNLALNREDLTPILMRLLSLSAAPLKSVERSFAVDSTGFRTSGFSMFATEKYGLMRQHEWIKAHACIGVKTNVITAIAITNDKGADMHQFGDLVRSTAENGFEMKEIMADKGYSSRESYNVAREVGAQAYIPFRSNATGRADGSLTWRKAFLYFQLNQEEFYKRYHLRSNVESAFSSIKKKFGDGLKSKNYGAQVNELLCKCIAYNIVVLIHEMEELKIKVDFTC